MRADLFDIVAAAEMNQQLLKSVDDNRVLYAESSVYEKLKWGMALLEYSHWNP